MNKETFLNDIKTNFGEEAKALHSKLWDKYGEPKCGNSRATYLSTHFVFKLPTNHEGIGQNEDECTLLSDDYYQYAKTKLIDPRSYLICMERVEHACYQTITQKLGAVPEFVSDIDCGQVGFNRKGQLVAYDFALTH